MEALKIMVQERVWMDRQAYEDAERMYYEKIAKGANAPAKTSLACELAKAREILKKTLEDEENMSADSATDNSVKNPLEKEISGIKLAIEGVLKDMRNMQNRMSSLEQNFQKLDLKCGRSQTEKRKSESDDKKCHGPPPHKQQKSSDSMTKKPSPAPNMEDEDVDLFGSDTEVDNEEAEKLKEKRLAEYASKKSKKPALIAKSNIILDVKPWDDETNMADMEKEVRKIQMDGLIWGASKLVPLAYGIHKLQISCVVEDDKVSVDELQEKIESFEDYVQSVDIAAFNKV